MWGRASGNRHAFSCSVDGGGPDVEVVLDLLRDGQEDFGVFFERDE